MAAVSRPPPLLRRSSTKPFTAGLSRLIFPIASVSSRPVFSLKVEMRR